jgi:hypothetical protein
LSKRMVFCLDWASHLEQLIHFIGSQKRLLD